MEFIKEFAKMGKDLSLLICGGSDFHGEVKPNVKLFQRTLPESDFENLEKAVAHAS